MDIGMIANSQLNNQYRKLCQDQHRCQQQHWCHCKYMSNSLLGSLYMKLLQHLFFSNRMSYLCKLSIVMHLYMMNKEEDNLDMCFHSNNIQSSRMCMQLQTVMSISSMGLDIFHTSLFHFEQQMYHYKQCMPQPMNILSNYHHCISTHTVQ